MIEVYKANVAYWSFKCLNFVAMVALVLRIPLRDARPGGCLPFFGALSVKEIIHPQGKAAEGTRTGNPPAGQIVSQVIRV